MASTAEAAKGIKKGAQANGTHTMRGIVTNITPDKSGYGIFEIRTAYKHQKNNGVNNANGATSQQQHRKFDVTNATTFQHHMGNAMNIVNPAALHRGQLVAVKYVGQHAEQVHIYTPVMHSSGRYYGNFMRHRPMAYYPHQYHHHRRY